VDGNLYELTEEIKLDKNIRHSIDIVVDRLAAREGIRKRLVDSIENVLQLSDGLMTVDVIDGEPIQFSQNFSCPEHGVSLSEIEPRNFSFNNPFGACPECLGIGYKMEFDIDLMIPDQSLSLNEGAIIMMGWQSSGKDGSWTNSLLQSLSKEYNFSLDTPFKELSKEVKDVIIYGTNGKKVEVKYNGDRGLRVYETAFEGLIKNSERRYRETGSDIIKQEYETFMVL
jgi:excinuclease ABC subunit A